MRTPPRYDHWARGALQGLAVATGAVVGSMLGGPFGGIIGSAAGGAAATQVPYFDDRLANPRAPRPGATRRAPPGSALGGPVWVYFERDADLGHAWVAHVLDLDLVTQGSSLAEAMEMARDATSTVVANYLQNPRAAPPRPAPQDAWDKLGTLFRRAPLRPLSTVVRREDQFSAMGVQLRLPPPRRR